MFNLDHPQKPPLFNYYAPKSNRFIAVLSIPHSGENIPQDFTPFLSGDLWAYKEDVDYKVHELIDIQALQNAGVAVLISNVHRICVDLNRSEQNCVLFWKDNTQGKRLVVKEPAPEEVEKLIEIYHRPYFEILKTSLRELEKRKAGLVSMIDLHSMPSRPTEYHMKQNPYQKTHRSDFCLSDRRGKTCSPEFINYFQSRLQEKGHESDLNNPYIGGFVTEFVNQFRTNNIQIEINRSIYMDETKKELLVDKVKGLKTSLTQVLISGFEKFDS